MKIVFRTDSSLAIGTGHMVRCLTLADKLRSTGADVAFVSRNLPGNVIETVSRRGFRVHVLPYEGDEIARDIRRSEYERWLTVESSHDAAQTLSVLANEEIGADWLVVDHYALDRSWHKAMRAVVGQIMVIDDIANREHDCNILLDQNLYSDPMGRYDGLIPAECQAMLGPGFALLRPQFADVYDHVKRSFGNVTRLLVFFGGSDATNETMKALAALDTLDRRDLQVDVVVGRVNPYREDIWEWCVERANAIFHENVTDMAGLMLQADLAIGAGGTTTWERCCLGLPSVLIAVADNQVAIAEEADRAGLAAYLGHSGEVTIEDIARAVTSLVDDHDRLREMSNRARQLVDGLGAERVITAMKEKSRQGVAL